MPRHRSARSPIFTLCLCPCSDPRSCQTELDADRATSPRSRRVAYGHDLLSSLGAPAMDLLIESLRSKREQNRMSAGTHYILIDGDTLSFEHQDASDQFVELQAAVLGIGETLFLSTGAFIDTEALELTDTLREQILGGDIDPLREAIITHPEEDSLVVRAWQPGDRFHHWAHRAAKSSKRLLYRPPYPTSGAKNATYCV